MDEKDTSMSSSEPNDSLKRFGSHVLFREFLYKYARRAASSTTLPSRSIMSNSTAVRSTSVRYGYLRETAGCGRFRSPRIRLGSLVAARGTRLDWTGELLSEPPSKSSPNGISEPLHDSAASLPPRDLKPPGQPAAASPAASETLPVRTPGRSAARTSSSKGARPTFFRD
eukprot:CAMPEP_0114536270 /NCGR_PEP_ID=MMETSP0109-20121206/28897_1 /TAXON_ID=29199 /ORGANISM="Chlorarachnion reptans, Strain CCCM449" /LENGTH=169 /DNA_ID=CAMNT_0001719965 /DNA_START=822 /DNA_END=1332 /DNA_ORIENTATION=-